MVIKRFIFPKEWRLKSFRISEAKIVVVSTESMGYVKRL